MSQGRSKQTILLVGGSSGIGLECAKILAPKSNLIVANRSPPPAAEVPRTAATFLALDLSSPQSVRKLVDEWKYGPISALALNAGVWPGSEVKFTEEGIETSFAVNHVNTALLFLYAQERGILTQDCRVIFVTTALHDPLQPHNQFIPSYTDPETIAKATDAKLKAHGVRYSTSKLATLYFSYALARKLTDMHSNMVSICYEPGFVPDKKSQLGRNHSAVSRGIFSLITPLVKFVVGRAGVKISTCLQSGAQLAAIATGDYLPGREGHGKYILLDEIHKSSEASYDVKKQDELWDWTINNLALDGQEKVAFDTLSGARGANGV